MATGHQRQRSGSRQGRSGLRPVRRRDPDADVPVQLPSANPVSSVYLAFIVSAKSQPCTPTWGTYYTLAAAEQSLNLDARTAEVRAQGGAVNVSFGGQANSELAVGCTNPAQLVNAYLAPIQRYHATTMDFDIEGATLAERRRRRPPGDGGRHDPASAGGQAHPATGLGDAAGCQRRFDHAGNRGGPGDAVGARHARRRQRDGDGLRARRRRQHDMIGTVESALTATRTRCSRCGGLGTSLSAAAAWGHVGATVMLGDNDSPANGSPPPTPVSCRSSSRATGSPACRRGR